MALISNGDQVLTKRVYNSDETVLWEGTMSKNGTATLSEDIKNFEEIKIVWSPWGIASNNETIQSNIFSSDTKMFSLIGNWYNGTSPFIMTDKLTYSNKTITHVCGNYLLIGGSASTSSDEFRMYRVIGIGRKGGN